MQLEMHHLVIPVRTPKDILFSYSVTFYIFYMEL